MCVFKAVALAFSLILAQLMLAPSASGETTVQEWHQYRFSQDKNAVISNDYPEIGDKAFSTEDEVRATPVVVGERMFVGNHNTGDVQAFDVSTGEKVWSSKAPNWVHSEMIYHDGTVFVGYGNRYFQGSGLRGTEESGVLALDAETGETMWQYSTAGEVMPTPVFANGSIYAATGDHHLYELDEESGDLVNKTDTGFVTSMSSPAYSDSHLYFGGGSPTPFTFTAFDTEKSKIAWQTEFSDVTAGLDDVPPAIEDGIVVTSALEAVSENENRQKLFALDSDDGEILWEADLGSGAPIINNKSGAPMIYNGTIFVGSPTTQKFYAYSLDTGELQWSVDSGAVKGAPVAKGGIVYFGNADGYLFALDAETGEQTGKLKLGGALAPSGPIIVNSTLMVGSQDSNVYAKPLEDIESPLAVDGDEDDASSGLLCRLALC